MATFTDVNGARWDVKTTSVQVDSNPGKETFFAALADDTTLDYSNNQFGVDDEDVPPAGTKLTWPAGGNPILRGRGGATQAIEAAKAFGLRAKQQALQNPAGDTRAVVVRASAPSSGAGLLVVIIIGIMLLGAKKR